MVWEKELRGTRGALWSGSTHKHLECSLGRSKAQVCLLSPLLPTTLSWIQLVNEPREHQLSNGEEQQGLQPPHAIPRTPAKVSLHSLGPLLLGWETLLLEFFV